MKQWVEFASPSWDLGIFTQLAKAYSNVEVPVVPIKGDGFNLMGDHFHPLLLVLGPVYQIFPSALTLLVIQDVLFAIAVFVVTQAAVRRLAVVPGLLVGVAFAVSFGIQNAVAAQFHEIAFAVPLLALSLESYLGGRWRSSIIWAAPLVFIKEDLGVTVAVIGALIAWRGRRPAGLWLAVWGLVWTLLAIMVILPLFSPDGRYGYGLAQSGQYVDLPSYVARAVAEPDKYQTVAALTMASGLIALRSPIMLVALPTLAWRFISSNPAYWGFPWHYNAILMPVVFLALIEVLRRFSDLSRLHIMVRVGAYALVAASAAIAIFTQPFAQLSDGSTAAEKDRFKAASSAIAVVPRGVRVEADIAMMHYLVPTTDVFWIHNDGNPPPEYLIIDRRNASWGGTPPGDVAIYAEERHPTANYRILFDDLDYQVAQRTD